MKFFRKFMVLALMFFIYSFIHISIAHAVSFEAKAVPIDDRIVIDEFAKFNINIKNNLKESKDEYRIYTLDFPIWDVRTDPIQNPITLELKPGEEGNVEIIVDPLKIRDIGTYQVNVNVRSKLTNQFIQVPLKVAILSTEPLIQGYVPTVVTGISIPEKIDPREEISIKISLNNQNIIDYPDLIVRLESNVIKEAINTQLGPKEDKVLEVKVGINPLAYPQEDNLVVSVFKGNRSIINPIVRKIEIVEYAAQEVLSKQKRFLLTRTRYKFLSNNNEFDGLIKIETSLLGSILSSTNPKAKILKENGKRYFAWEVELKDNSMQVAVTKNLLPLFVVILLLAAVAISYYALRSPLAMRKEAENVARSEGGISEMTVILHVKNRSKDKLKEIEITEFIPALVSIGREVSIGSLQPTKILRHEKSKNTVLKWSLDHLDASEERVLSYKIKAKLAILGTFSLPTATASFKSGNNVLTSASNRLTIDN